MSEMKLSPYLVESVPTINADDVYKNLDSVVIIDVRREEEFHGELGHIEKAQLLTLGSDLTDFLKSYDKSKEIVFVCRSGARSGHATQESQDLGYKKTMNMAGGMIGWNEKKYPIVK